MPRVAFILPGLGRVQRGAETAFWQIAKHLARFPDMDVETFGSGNEGPEETTFHHVPCVRRELFEHWPGIPCFRNECYYEELSFVLGLIGTRRYRPGRFDVAVACTYPYVNWYLQRMGRNGGPRQIFVTENGDWMCQARNSEYRFFGCDGLVCFNPEYYERNRHRYRTVLIPNGVDPTEFHPASKQADGISDNDDARLAAIPRDRPTVLMVSAMIPSKRVAEGIRAVARVPHAFLVIAGDGPERQTFSQLAAELLPDRHLLLGSVSNENMPALFRRATAFLHMSKIEPFGIVYLEAAATGLPIVAPDLETPRWILGDTALYADSEEPASIANAISRAISPEVGRELGAAARRRVLANWTWDIQAGKYRDFILDVVGHSDATEPIREATDDFDHHCELQHS